ncbi:type VI secretion protein [Candidatus Magnetomorum sp. HK-1]|nr:type VI secretion protein [Candidatus Magnetomorum sp. HK-1]
MIYKTANINWHEGMLLLPQHFQLSDQSLLATLGDQMKAQAYHWGILEINIDQNALTESHIFSVEKVKLRMESGIWVDIPGNSYADDESFRQYPYDNDKAISIWLGIHRQENSEAYKADSLPLFEQNSSEQEFEIQVSRRVVKIFFEEPSSEFESIKIGEINRAQNSDMPVFNEKYIPPLLNYNTNRFLKEKLNHLVLSLKDHSDILRYKISNPNFYQKNDTMIALKSFSQAQIETSSWLILSQMTETEKFNTAQVREKKTLHPYVLYIELLRLWGSLIIFQQSEMEVMPQYQHDRLSDTFGPLFKSLNNLLDQEKKSNIEVREFVNSNNRWLCRIEREWLYEDSRFYISINTERLKNPDADYLTKQGVKIAPKSQIDNLVAHRKTGMIYKPIRPVPPGLPDRSDLQYYKLDIDPDQPFWDYIKRELTIVLRDISFSEIPEIKLFIEKKQEK